MVHSGSRPSHVIQSLTCYSTFPEPEPDQALVHYLSSYFSWGGADIGILPLIQLPELHRLLQMCDRQGRGFRPLQPIQACLPLSLSQ